VAREASTTVEPLPPPVVLHTTTATATATTTTATTTTTGTDTATAEPQTKERSRTYLCCLFNARSIVYKLYALQQLLYVKKYDLVYVTEMWLHSDIANGLLDPGPYTPFIGKIVAALIMVA